MQVKVNHYEVLYLKSGEEEIVLQIPSPSYIYKIGDEVTLNIMRPEQEENFEIFTTKVVKVEHTVLDYGEGEQIIRVTLEKTSDSVQGTTSK